ncbi:hypothetical protein VWX35_16310 [Phaeobacter sp. A36a-5a]|uniref:hypothetical protein n=1 Tax=Phaeobacter bryozoorum TaxID=1086632 RepID=UPI0030C9CA7D
MLSSVLSIFGLGQKHTHAVSAKYSEATQLNAEFELNLNNTIELLRSEQLHLRHRIAAICEHPDDESTLLGQVNPLIEQLISETEVGLTTSQNTQVTISNSSRFASMRKWDECLGILHRQVAAPRHQFNRVERVIGQFHRVLDNVQQEDKTLEGFEESTKSIELD